LVVVTGTALLSSLQSIPSWQVCLASFRLDGRISGIMSGTVRSTVAVRSRSARWFRDWIGRSRRSRIAQWLGRYARLIIVVAITGVAAFLGFFLRPQDYPIPASPSGHPVLDVMASRPGVTVTVSQAVVYHDNLGVDLTASTLSGRSTYTLYVEVSGVHVSWYGGNPLIFSPGSRVASDGPGGEYSIGRSYLLKPGYSYNLTFSVSYAGCGCLRVSGPYVSVSPLELDPVLLTSTKTNAGGIPVTPHVNTVGWPNPRPSAREVLRHVTVFDSRGPDRLVRIGYPPESDRGKCQPRGSNQSLRNYVAVEQRDHGQRHAAEPCQAEHAEQQPVLCRHSSRHRRRGSSGTRTRGVAGAGNPACPQEGRCCQSRPADCSRRDSSRSPTRTGAHCAFPGRSSATRDATTDHGACGAGRNPRSYHRPDP
jgi:hypothetical protein